jgi:hypothetical protein
MMTNVEEKRAQFLSRQYNDVLAMRYNACILPLKTYIRNNIKCF